MPEILFFPYFGPNRRSDKRVVELRLDFSADKDSDFPQRVEDIGRILKDAGILTAGECFPEEPLPDGRVNWYSSLLVQTALLFQHKCGHRADYFRISEEPGRKRYLALVEYAHCDVGMTAVKLAIETMNGSRQTILEPFRQFSEFARARVLPSETDAIIKAAIRRDIPYFQLEQEPFSGKFKTGFGVRPNGLLMLGHGAASRILDGTFCIDKSGEYVTALLRNPGQRRALLQQLGVPFSNDGTDNQAVSDLYHILNINGQLSVIKESPDGSGQMVDNFHSSLGTLIQTISKLAEFAPVAVSLKTTDITKPLGETGGVVLDFDLAPNLGVLLGQCERGPDLLDSAANHLIDWLFPGPGNTRMPIIAVTGTNGKTTTSRMIRHILELSGHRPGLVCTDGIFLNGRQISREDSSSFIGHARVLTSKLVDTAVLETHHRGIAVRGFAFEKCEIAVCLNVTREHLAKGEIESVEQMAEVKRALLERASDVAVLNADDDNCRLMPAYLTAERICFVSMQSSVDQLRDLAGSRSACFCVLENVRGEQWLVIYDGKQRLPLMDVAQIPASFDGTARFNVSNAMHAAAATFFFGIHIDQIRAALGSFSAGRELTPGRMNVIDDLPFRIIIDFAHNADGMKKLCEFVDLQKVKGLKRIAFAGPAKSTDEANRRSAQAVAGHFDFYFCKEYEPPEPISRRLVGPFMQQVLVEEGVPENKTMLMTFGREVIFRILDACEPGDLLILLVGHAEIHSAPPHINEYIGHRSKA